MDLTAIALPVLLWTLFYGPSMDLTAIALPVLLWTLPVLLWTWTLYGPDRHCAACPSMDPACPSMDRPDRHCAACPSMDRPSMDRPSMDLFLWTSFYGPLSMDLFYGPSMDLTAIALPVLLWTFSMDLFLWTSSMDPLWT
jgi:hypothetical protein